ncbi:TRIO and F-actin-binding protein-like [Sander lucioperca]|uniref:TRIO and F-actin-binding protein-like n=1 Tax=Sander lucioperca TaxID=283035 RepID=UPI00125D2029|nr:TRIO and F-actin-binding protein-like [Sander lucioperca]
MFRSIFGLKFFARPRSSGNMDSSSKKSKRRSERPSSPEDLNPPTILREHGRRGERPSSSGGTNPSTIMKEHRQRGESPLSCAENKPSTTRQQIRRRESLSSSSSEDDQPSSTRQRVRRFDSPSSSSSEDDQPSTPRRKQAWRGESPPSSSSEDDQPSSTRQRVRRFESPSSSSSEDDQPSTPRRKQAWRGESPPSSSSEDDQPSSTRQRVRRFESPSSSSSEDDQPSTPRRQQEKRAESSSSSFSEDDEPSTTRRQQQQSNLYIVDFNLSTTFRQDEGIGENHLPCVDIDHPSIWWERVRRVNPSNTLRQDGSGDSPSSTFSSSEDDEPSTTWSQQERKADSLSARKERELVEIQKQHYSDLRCEKMKIKKERKTFGLLSRIYIWWLEWRIDRCAREIQSTCEDACYLQVHGHLRNPETMAKIQKELLDRRNELAVSYRRQVFKLEMEVRKQRLKSEDTPPPC